MLLVVVVGAAVVVEDVLLVVVVVGAAVVVEDVLLVVVVVGAPVVVEEVEVVVAAPAQSVTRTSKVEVGAGVPAAGLAGQEQPAMPAHVSSSAPTPSSHQNPAPSGTP